MKRLSKLAAVALAFAVLSGPVCVFAADSTETPPAEKSEKPKAEKKKGSAPFHGKLTAIDQTAKTISVGERTFQVTSETKISKDGKPATLADAKVGDEVGGACKKNEDGTLSLTSLRIGPKPEKAEGASKKAKKEKKTQEEATPDQ